MLDDGRLTDGQGRTVDFRNTVIIMTSNIGSDIIHEQFDSASYDDIKTQLFTLLRSQFKPEFLNRIDDVVMFNSLDKENIHKIIDIELNGLFGRVNNLGYTIKITEAVLVQKTEPFSAEPYHGSYSLRAPPSA